MQSKTQGSYWYHKQFAKSVLWGKHNNDDSINSQNNNNKNVLIFVI